MATLFDSPPVRARLRRLEPVGAGSGGVAGVGVGCDCTSYSYLVLSLVLFGVGTAVTVLALGDADGRLFNHLGHMWLVGPVFICSGMMVAVKSMLYLRRKSVIQMLLHQRALFRELAAVQAEQAFASGQVPRTASTATLPPAYDALIICGSSVVPAQQTSSSEVPPPTYDEAMFLIADEKIHSIREMKNGRENVSKDFNVTSNDVCQNMENTKP
ncbi:uncharacterized protein LOC143914868 [Arctopsyche grandis]|uniref:uncharacterized protein LOC143914868 n=1 Tax=Arctopsyche grandis TaxID=121162 RepID=UPI00406D6386